jgi:hypothetical protein
LEGLSVSNFFAINRCFLTNIIPFFLETRYQWFLLPKGRSPTGNLSKSINPPYLPLIPKDSLNVLQLRDREWIQLVDITLPNHEWHWQHFCISGFERWIAFNSWTPVSAEETAAPPIPIL